ncbi:hypothetical protein ACFVP3_39520 [Streptomyces sp. NPDC057806]|uniref:hypothetical protein n=1 Tax=Streptomyces sp. NPDC057806 TaxID=3346255 RepID=UPI0036A7133C
MVNHVTRVYYAVYATVMVIWDWLAGRIEAVLLLLPPRGPVVGPARRERGPGKGRLQGCVEGLTTSR